MIRDLIDLTLSLLVGREIARERPEEEMPRQKTKKAATLGEPGATVQFLIARPGVLDLDPESAEWAVFKAYYLKPLGLTREEIAVTPVIPGEADDPDSSLSYHELEQWEDWLRTEVDRIGAEVLVAVGPEAASAVDRQFYALTVPHPRFIQAYGPPSTLERTIEDLRTRVKELRSGERLAKRAAIVKQDAPQRIVYGAVLDPYVEDLQGDWIPVADVEAAAHGWMLSSREIGLLHQKEAAAAPVESYIVSYPTPEDEVAAKAGQEHDIYKLKLGSGEIHSGMWVVGVKVLDEALWALVEAGKLDAFSIGGEGFRAPATKAEMPKVKKIIELFS